MITILESYFNYQNMLSKSKFKGVWEGIDDPIWGGIFFRKFEFSALVVYNYHY